MCLQVLRLITLVLRLMVLGLSGIIKEKRSFSILTCFLFCDWKLKILFPFKNNVLLSFDTSVCYCCLICRARLSLQGALTQKWPPRDPPGICQWFVVEDDQGPARSSSCSCTFRSPCLGCPRHLCCGCSPGRWPVSWQRSSYSWSSTYFSACRHCPLKAEESHPVCLLNEIFS